MNSVPLAPGNRLLVLSDPAWDLATIARALRDDSVVLITDVRQDRADLIVSDVAAQFGLGERLQLHATFASVLGQRENVGRNFMTVDRRAEYEFIPAHSEGTLDTGMQFAAFYCQENSTDGGHTLLYNLDENGSGWARLLGVKMKIDLGGQPATQTEIINARVRLGIYIPQDIVKPEDHVLDELPSPWPGRRIYRVLSPSPRGTSQISGRDVPGYWDNIASADHSACEEFIESLQEAGLLRLPSGSTNPAVLDNARRRRVWRSGVKYSELFKAKIIHKLKHGDLLLQNNLTWAHGVSNWTPGSGVRRVAAAFA